METIIKNIKKQGMLKLHKEHGDYMCLNLKEMALELLQNYDDETVAYSIGVSLLYACGYLRESEV